MTQSFAPRTPSVRWFAEALASLRIPGNHALIAAFLVALAPHLPAEGLERALALARAFPDYELRAATLTRLLPFALPELRSTLALEVYNLVEHVRTPGARSSMLATLAPHLPDSYIEQAIVRARSDGAAVGALIALAPRLPPAQQAAVYAEACSRARALPSAYERAHRLIELAPQLHGPDHAYACFVAFVAVYQLNDTQALAPGVLQQLVALLPDAIVPDVYALLAVPPVPDPWGGWNHVMLAEALAPRLPAALFASELANALTNTPEELRMHHLVALMHSVPAEMLAEARRAARTITDQWCQAWVLAALATRLPPSQQRVLYKRAVRLIRAELSDAGQSSTMAALKAIQAGVPIGFVDLPLALSQLDPAQLPQLVAWLMSYIFTPAQQAAIQNVLAVHLTPTQLNQALDAVRVRTETAEGTVALGMLVAYLPPEQRVPVATQALSAIDQLADPPQQSLALLQLAPHLPDEVLLLALELVASNSDEINRPAIVAQLTLRLAAQLPTLSNAEPVQRAAYRYLFMLAIRSNNCIAEEFASLLPLLVAGMTAEELAMLPDVIGSLCWEA